MRFSFLGKCRRRKIKGKEHRAFNAFQASHFPLFLFSSSQYYIYCRPICINWRFVIVYIFDWVLSNPLLYIRSMI